MSASKQIRISEVDDMLLIYGPRSAWNSLSFNPYANRIGAANASNVFQGIDDIAMDRAISWGTSIGLVANIATNTYALSQSELDRIDYAAAMTVDTGTTVGTALLSGAVAGMTVAFIAGLPALGIGAVAGAVIGGILGAATALATSSILEATGAREHITNAVGDLYRSWVDG